MLRFTGALQICICADQLSLCGSVCIALVSAWMCMNPTNAKDSQWCSRGHFLIVVGTFEPETWGWRLFHYTFRVQRSLILEASRRKGQVPRPYHEEDGELVERQEDVHHPLQFWFSHFNTYNAQRGPSLRRPSRVK